jgi:hypothetical protein
MRTKADVRRLLELMGNAQNATRLVKMAKPRPRVSEVQKKPAAVAGSGSVPTSLRWRHVGGFRHLSVTIARSCRCSGDNCITASWK